MSKSNSEKSNPLLYLVQKMWQYSKGNRRKAVVFYGMFTAASFFDIFLPPFIGAKMINEVQVHGMSNLKLLCFWASLPILVDLAFWLFHGPARVMENVNAFKVRANYRKSLLSKIIARPMEWHAEHHSGDTIDKIEKGTSALYGFSSDSFEILYAIIQLVGSFAMLMYFCPWSSPIVLGMLVLSVWVTTRFDRVMIPNYKELNQFENKVSESTSDMLTNISTVVILRVERLVFGAIVKRIEKPKDLFHRNNVLNESKWCITSIITSFMGTVVLVLYFWLHWRNHETVLVGSVFILDRYLRNAGQVFFRFTGMYSEIVVRKTKLMNAEELSEGFKSECLTNHVLPVDWRTLRIDGLNFSYHTEDDDLHLSNVSLSISKGERVALVGESGSGKTTLLKVMRDLYHPMSLKLSADDRGIIDGFGGISRAIALVPQNPEIFGTTIRENITLGAEHDEAVIRHFTDMACFTDVVDSLPKGFESSINEKGVNLSGGQQQRLALSRGLLACHDKDIVLLDEPTASLDTATEMRIYENIFRAFQGKTVVSSIHRLHLLPLFDTIYYFHQGQIIASGNMIELLGKCPEFREAWQMYNLQSKEVVV